MTDTSQPSSPTQDPAEIDAALLADVKDAVEEHDTRWLARTLQRMHPADAADLLEQLPYDAFEEAVELLGGELPPDILIELRDSYREGAVDMLPDHAVANALDELDSDDATTILDDLDDDRRERILEDLAPIDRAQLERGLAYEEETAGRLMQTEFVALPEFWTVGQSIDYARKLGTELPEVFYEVYVTDPAHRLAGVVSLATLLRSPRDTPLSDIMEDPMSSITTDMDQEEVAYQFQKYSLASAPVKDSAGRLVGMITVDDMVDVIQEENREDLLALSGVSEAGVNQSVYSAVKARLPWLAATLVAAFLASTVVALFEATIDQVVALAILMPVIAGLCGNAGSQSLAGAVRAIAERDLEGPLVARAVRREIFTALANGAIIALLSGVVTWLWFGDAMLGVVIAAALLFTFIWAGFVGIMAPLMLKKMGVDPAVASGVFVLTSIDLMGFFVFLGLATIILL